MIEIHDTTVVHTVFFVPGEKMDYLGTLLRQPGEPWKYIFRFRYIVDNELGSASEDRKSWYTSELSDSDGDGRLERALDAIRLTVAMVADRNGTDYHEVTIKGGVLELYEKLRGQSWAHHLGMPS